MTLNLTDELLAPMDCKPAGIHSASVRAPFQFILDSFCLHLGSISNPSKSECQSLIACHSQIACHSLITCHPLITCHSRIACHPLITYWIHSACHFTHRMPLRAEIGPQSSSNGAQMELKSSSKWSSKPSGSQMELKWSSNGGQMQPGAWSPVELKWSSNRARTELKWRSNRAGGSF